LLKDFYKENATAGPKLVTSLKQVPNSTKVIRRKLEKTFGQKFQKKSFKEEKKAEDTTSITQRIFGIGDNNHTASGILA
jgi:hypothetical protein